MRYGEIPVGLSTGVPEISVPIYTLVANGLKIPINISYHASGIKVKDVSSSIGLGWVLNAGGTIIQTGIDGLENPSETSQLQYINAQYIMNDIAVDRNNYFISGNYSLEPSWLQMNNLVNDVYTFNFNGNNGTFRYTPDGCPVMVPYSPLKVESVITDDGVGSMITITDTEGRNWTFERMGNESTSSFLYALIKISFPDTDDEVLFTYDKESFGINYFHESEYNGTYSVPFASEEPLSLKSRHRRHVERVSGMGLNVMLKKISWRDIDIEFGYSSSQDAKIENRLTSISVKAAGVISHSTSLDHKYLGSTADAKRMLLDWIKVNTDRYTFNYNMTPLPSYELETKDKSNYMSNLSLVNYEDYWGYPLSGSTDFLIPFFGTNPWHDNGTLINNTYYPRGYTYFRGREADNSTPQNGILTEIIYPTKGKTVFEYEKNYGSNVYGIIGRSNDGYFGGVRVKTIRSYANANSEVADLIKSYEYEGGPSLPIRQHHFVYWQSIFNGQVNERPVNGALPVDFIYGFGSVGANIGTSSSLSVFSEPGAPSVFYHTVTEYIGTPDSNQGKTIYNFIKNSDIPQNIQYMGSIPRAYSEYQNVHKGIVPHLLASKKEYAFIDGEYVLRKEVQNEYTTQEKDPVIVGVELGNYYSYNIDLTDYDRIWFEMGIRDKYTVCQVYYDSFVAYNVYAIPSFDLLSRTITKNYTDSGICLESVINYSYDPQFRLLSPIATTTVNSDGKHVYESFIYPFDEDIVGMVNRNIISPVIQKTQIIAGASKIQRTEYIAKNYGKGKTRYMPDIIKTGTSTSNLESRVICHKRDLYGNPVYVIKDGVEKIVYIWGYKGRFPVAEIRNATYEDINSILGESVLTSITGNLSPSASEWRALRSLQTDSRLIGALITINEYNPIWGITKSVSPSGSVTSYAYLNGRLNSVFFKKNENAAESEVLQSYLYNYKQ